MALITSHLYLRSDERSTYLKKTIEQKNAEDSKAVYNPRGSDKYDSVDDPAAYIKADIHLSNVKSSMMEGSSITRKYDETLNQIDRSKNLVTELKKNIMGLFSGSGDGQYSFFQEQCKKDLSILTGILNENVNFSGIACCKPVVQDLSTLPFANEIDTISTEYYLGSVGGQKLSFDDMQIDHFPVTADHPFFSKIIHAYRLCLGADPTNDGQNCLKKAQDLCDEVIKDAFVDAQNRVAFEKQKLDTVVKNLPEKEKMLELEQQDKNQNNQLLALMDFLMTKNSLKVLNEMMTGKNKFQQDMINKLTFP